MSKARPQVISPSILLSDSWELLCGGGWVTWVCGSGSPAHPRNYPVRLWLAYGFLSIQTPVLPINHSSTYGGQGTTRRSWSSLTVWISSTKLRSLGMVADPSILWASWLAQLTFWPRSLGRLQGLWVMCSHVREFCWSFHRNFPGNGVCGSEVGWIIPGSESSKRAKVRDEFLKLQKPSPPILLPPSFLFLSVSLSHLFCVLSGWYIYKVQNFWGDTKCIRNRYLLVPPTLPLFLPPFLFSTLLTHFLGLPSSLQEFFAFFVQTLHIWVWC